jgi:hypothetical protein
MGFVHGSTVVVIDVTPVPPVPISRGRTVILISLSILLMEWTVECLRAESKPNMQDMQEVLILIFFFAGQFAAVKYRSETYYWTQKLNRED